MNQPVQTVDSARSVCLSEFPLGNVLRGRVGGSRPLGCFVESKLLIVVRTLVLQSHQGCKKLEIPRNPLGNQVIVTYRDRNNNWP